MKFNVGQEAYELDMTDDEIADEVATAPSRNTEVSTGSCAS